MARALKKYENGLSIRFLKRPKKYYITFGVMHIKVNGEFLSGFDSIEDADVFVSQLKPIEHTSYDWKI